MVFLILIHMFRKQSKRSIRCYLRVEKEQKSMNLRIVDVMTSDFTALHKFHATTILSLF